MLLKKFENEFKIAINKKDKELLSGLFKFPFYCSPCIDYTQATDSLGATVKVTKSIFNSSVYRLFFELPSKNKLTKDLWAKSFYYLTASNDNGSKVGFVISYTISPPSNNWEGSQGFIYLRKIKGKYIIDGLDTVP